MFPPITAGIVSFWLVYVLSFEKQRFGQLFSSPLVGFWVAYYALMILGLFYTPNAAEAGRDLTLKISLLLWPLGFASWAAPIIKYRDRVLLIFAATTVLSALVIVFYGVFLWAQSGAPASRMFNYLNIYDTVPNHYIALYASFGAFIFLQLFLQKKLAAKWAFPGMAILLFLLGIISVRIQLIAFPVAVFFFLFFYKTDAERKRKLLKIGTLAILLMGVLAAIMPSTRTRVLETVDELRSFNKMVDLKQTNHRVFLWKYGAEVVAENPLLGTGTGAADDALNLKLEDCDAIFWNGHANYYLRDNRYNFHNAFLQHFATHGIFGALILLLLFVLPFVFKSVEMDGLRAAFLTLCFIAFITESMLERQAGVLFFGFFYALLFIPPKDSTSGK